MDPLSITASVIAILQLTSNMIGLLKDVKDAPAACQHCENEASNLHSLLINLLYHLNQKTADGDWYVAVQALNIENGPLDQYKKALMLLQSKTEPLKRYQDIKRRLLWTVDKKEVADILARMERLKGLLGIALEMDHFKLSLEIRKNMSILPALETNVLAIRETQARQGDARNLRLHDDILYWLSPADYQQQQHDIISRRQDGTGEWFLESTEFKRWLDGSDKTLFCPGMPGAGKTMVSAIAIDHLRAMKRRADVEIAHIFCNYKTQAEQSALCLTSNLLKQLVQAPPDMDASVTSLYQSHMARHSRPSITEVFEILQSVCSNYTTVFFIVDALDEHADQDGPRYQLIDGLRELQSTSDVRVLVTSRFVPEVVQLFQANTILEVRASEEDVRRFVAGQMHTLPRYDEQLQRLIEDKIANAAHGMFLLARLYVELLRDKRRKRDVLSTLDELAKGSGALSVAYDKIVQQIENQLPGDSSLAKRAICWVAFAKRPMTTKELCHALSVQQGDKALEDDDIYNIKDVTTVCVGLVVVDEESDIVRLVHYTTQDYFEQSMWRSSALEDIALVCLTYLSFDVFESGSCESDEAFELRLVTNAFFDYSAHYWSDHVRPVECSPAIVDTSLTFLLNERLMNSTTQIRTLDTPWLPKQHGYSQQFGKVVNGIHLTARYGLLHLTEKVLLAEHGETRRSFVDAKDGWGFTPLLLATMGEHEAVVRLLIQTGKADVNFADNSGTTILYTAVSHRQEAIVRLLVETGKLRPDRDALLSAAGKSPDTFLRLLVENGPVCVDRKTLITAILQGHEAIVRSILENGKVEPDLRSIPNADVHGKEALLQALL